MKDERVSRRRFMTGSALVGAGVVVTIPAQGADKDEAEMEIIAFPFSEYDELTEVGGWVDEELEDGTEVLLARVDENKFVCVSLKCTHQNCDLEYNPKSKLFDCPCHQSSFDLNGKPNGGPATKPLRKFPAEMACVIRKEK